MLMNTTARADNIIVSVTGLTMAWKDAELYNSSDRDNSLLWLLSGDDDAGVDPGTTGGVLLLPVSRLPLLST